MSTIVTSLLLFMTYVSTLKIGRFNFGDDVTVAAPPLKTEMGDRLATIDMGRKLGAVPLLGRELGPI